MKKLVKAMLTIAIVMVLTKTTSAQLSDLTWLDSENWVYNDGEVQTYGILKKPVGNGPFRAVLLNHAGFASAEQVIANHSKFYLDNGFVVISCDYTHTNANSHNHPVPSWLQGVRSDFAYSETNVGRADKCIEILQSLSYVDSNRIVAAGHSMGAILSVGLAADMPDKIKAVCITAGGISDELQIYSTLENAESIIAPICIFHGEDDNVVDANNSLALKKVLDKTYVPCLRIVHLQAGHNIAKAERIYFHMENWFNQYVPSPDSTSNTITPLSIRTPIHESIFDFGSDILVELEISEDFNNEISTVEYYDGATSLGTSTEWPFSFTWKNAVLGSHSLTAVITNPKEGQSGTISTTSALKVTVSETTGFVDENNKDDNLFSIFPNPTNGVFTLESKSGIRSVEIYNLSGIHIFSKQKIGLLSYDIDLSKVASGIYFIRLEDINKNIFYTKFIKKQ